MEKLFLDEKNNKLFYLIIYDISENKKRKKVSDIIDGYGMRVQYSSYEVWINEKQLQSLIKKLDKLHDENDSIRIYKLSQKPNVLDNDTISEQLQCDVVIC